MVDQQAIFVKIKIRDEGEGIQIEDLKHIFERFYKAKKSSENSIGIGLALAKTIIEKENGYIKVESIVGEGTEFEIKLRNEMTQKAIARECAEWIKRKAVFRSNTTGENMPGFMTVDNGEEKVAYMPLNGFTTVDIGCDRGNNAYNMVQKTGTPFATAYIASVK